MKNIHALLVALTLSLGWTVPAVGQDASKATAIDLGFDLGPPGANVSLALQLNAPAQASVASASTDLSFPASLFSVQEVKPSQAGDTEVAWTSKPDGKKAG